MSPSSQPQDLSTSICQMSNPQTEQRLHKNDDVMWNATVRVYHCLFGNVATVLYMYVYPYAHMHVHVQMPISRSMPMCMSVSMCVHACAFASVDADVDADCNDPFDKDGDDIAMIEPNAVGRMACRIAYPQHAAPPTQKCIGTMHDNSLAVRGEVHTPLGPIALGGRDDCNPMWCRVFSDNASWYLVMVSATFVAPLALTMLSLPCCTHSCNHDNSTSRCLILPRPIVATKHVATAEPV